MKAGKNLKGRRSWPEKPGIKGPGLVEQEAVCSLMVNGCEIALTHTLQPSHTHTGMHIHPHPHTRMHRHTNTHT